MAANTLSPISNSDPWTYFLLKGVASPGTIPPNGVRGFERETGWDEKAGKGTQGATLTLKTIPPARGMFLLQLFQDLDFVAWDYFVNNVLSIAPSKQQASGLTIFYPGFTSITQVVVAKYTDTPYHVGRGKYHVEVHLIEWQPPPPVSIVSTVGATFPDLPGPDDQAQNPEIAALQAQLGQANAQLAMLNHGANP